MLRKFFMSTTGVRMRFCTASTPEGIYNKKDINVKNVTMLKDLESLQRQIIWRSNNLGMKELDLVVGSWAKKNAKQMTYEQCQRFHEQVLEKETPELFQIVLNATKIDPQYEYLVTIQDYAFNSKDKNLAQNQ